MALRLTGDPRGTWTRPEVDMSTRLAGLELPDPVLTASGCAAAGRELEPFVDLGPIGAVVTKSIMLNPRVRASHAAYGRDSQRHAELDRAAGPGHRRVHRPGTSSGCVAAAPAPSCPLPGPASTSTRGSPASSGWRDGVDAIEVNISCPNVEDRGLVFACDPDAAAAVVRAVRRGTSPSVPVFAKLSPDVTDIVRVAQSVVDAGADGLSVINTTLGMVIDTATMKPVLAGITGGLSGPAIRPIAVRCVWQIHAALPEVPILGMGGIRSGLDALQFVLAGASAVSVGTVVFHDPGAVTRISHELADALAQRGFGSLTEAVGYAHRDAPGPHIDEDPEPFGAEG